MNSLIAGLSLSLLLASSSMAAEPPVFPFQTYAEAIALQSDSPIPACENGGVIVFLGEEWRVLSWPDRDLFMHLDATGTPDWIYVTTGTFNEGRITVKAVLPLVEAKKRYPTGCEYGDERGA